MTLTLIDVLFAQYVDGQMSLNHVLNFSHQLMFRLATEALDKATPLEKVRLAILLDRLKTTHALGKENLKLVSKNIDFAQLTIQAKLHAGQNGVVNLTVRDILAQAPVLLKLNVSKEKNIGALPLVPYIISFKPQDTGDIFLEIYHFSHDDDGRQVPGTVQQAASSTGTFSTSYNKVMNTVTASKAAAAAATSHHAGRDRASSVASTQSSSSTLPGNRYAVATTSTTHLLVRHEQLKAELAETLRSAPKGDEADSIVVLVVRSPHISMIVDKATTLKPGAELFTMVIGPQKKGWQPFGTVNMFDESEREDREQAASRERDGGDPDEDDDLQAAPAEAGCPMMMQTAPGIKILTEVPKADVKINLPGLVRFTLAHFKDLPVLKEYLESCESRAQL